MKILFETEESIQINMSGILTQRGIENTDITEAELLIKADATDTDLEAVVVLSLSDGLVWDSDNTTLLATLRPTDWGEGKLFVGSRYKWGFGFKTTSNTRFVEVSLTDSDIRIVQDFIRG